MRDPEKRSIDDSKLVTLTLYTQKGEPVETYYCRPTFDDGIMALRLAKRLQNIDTDDIYAMIDDRVPVGFFAKLRYFFRKDQGTALDPIFHELETFVVKVFRNQFTRKQLAHGVTTTEMIEVIMAIAAKQQLKTSGLARPKNVKTGQRTK